MDSDVGVLLEPVLLWAPPTREIVDTWAIKGVEKVKLADDAVPAESVEKAAKL
jgi:hypothetical protein